MADDQAQGGPASYRAPGGPAPDEPTRGHPVKAMLGGILVLWLFLWIIIPNPKDQPIDPTTGATKTTPGMTTGTPNVPHVTSRTVAELQDFNVVAVLVPPDTTDEQVGHLLSRFKTARIDGTLGQYITATSRGNKLGPHAIADIYVFSDGKWATPAALRAVVEGRHNAADAKIGGMTFDEVAPHVRGHYMINLHEPDHRDRASVGYADEEAGYHGPGYRELF